MIRKYMQAKRSPRRDFKIAVFLMLMSGISFALMNLFSRLTGDIPSLQKTFYRNIVVFIVSLITLRISLKKKPRKLYSQKADIGWLILRSAFGTVGLVAVFFTMDRLPIAIASVLHKLSPFFTIIFAAIFLKEKVNKSQIIGILLAFIGVLFITRPSQASSIKDPFAIFVGIIGGLGAGLAYTTVRFLGKRKVDSQFMVCFFAGFSCLVILPYLIFHHSPMTWKQFLGLLLVGVAGLAGQYGLTFAYTLASPKEISIYDYSNVLFTTLLGIVVLQQIPNFYDVLGILIVFIALLTMFLYNQKEASVLQE